MTLSRYQRFAYRALGGVVQKPAQQNVHLRLSLQKAHIHLRPEVYLGYSYLNMLLVFVAFAMLAGVLGLLIALHAVAVGGSVFLFVVPLPIVLAATLYVLTYVLPDVRAASRARDIDAKLPYALNYIATMASAGITPDKIFWSLSNQAIYGEVANEAAWISRDLRLLGKDIPGALTAAIDRSPSVKWQDLLQGAIAAVTTGGDLKTYFLAKSEQFMYENRQEQKRFLENLGVLAESFVTVVVAAPLFLLVLLSVMTLFGSDPRSGLSLGYIIVLVLLPMAQLGFLLTIKYVTPEV
ncbi:MAG: type II secretion system F family protein [Halobacteriales archaeon]|nr:type II secretion system F family protein [Halobacteriales archaeon]